MERQFVDTNSNNCDSIVKAENAYAEVKIKTEVFDYDLYMNIKQEVEENFVKIESPDFSEMKLSQQETKQGVIKEIKYKAKKPSQSKSKEVLANFYCYHCNASFKLKASLKRHLPTHLKEKPYACKLCNFRTARTNCLNVHVKNHQRTGVKHWIKKYACEVCDFKTARTGSLQIHMKRHCIDKPFACECCDYRTANKHRYKEHLKTHVSEKPFSCQLCNYKSVRKFDLRRHTSSVHSVKRSFLCTYCDYKTLREDRLEQHIRIHTGEKAFACEYCGYKTAIKQRFREHLKTHLGGKPFACACCKYRSERKHDLRRHILHVHIPKILQFCR